MPTLSKKYEYCYTNFRMHKNYSYKRNYNYKDVMDYIDVTTKKMIFSGGYFAEVIKTSHKLT